MQQIGLDATLNNVPDFTGGIDKMNRAVDSFAKNSQDAGGGFGAGFGEIVTGALRQIGTLAVDALLKAGQAVAGFVKDSIGLAGDFQANMLQFQSVAGKAVDTKGLEQFKQLFLDLGKELPVSTSEVQQAAIEMVKGGIDPATIAAGGLRQNIQFAAAAMGGDLVKAAEISAKILGGWTSTTATGAEKADFLTHSTDLLARAANASSTDVEGLSRGIFQAQGIAKTAGVSFDDLTTTLAELAPRFGSSAEAGTSLKNLIVRLQPTTQPAIDAMTQLGLYTDQAGSAFYDASGNFVGFEQASQLLQDSLQGLTKEQQAAALQTIFGNDAMSSASALAELGAQGYTNMAAALENANGVAASAELKQQGFNTALDNAKGSVEALQITIGSALLPVLTDLMNNVVAPAVNTLTDFASALFGDDDAFNKLSPTMQGIATTIGVLVADVQEIVGAFKDAGAGSSEFAQRIGDLASDLGLPGKLITNIITTVESLIGAFSAAGSESSSLGSALTQLNGVWALALKVVQDVGNGYMAVARSVLPIIQNLWRDHGAEISAFVKTTYDQVISIIRLALELYDAIVPPILNAIAGFFEAHGSEVEKILTGAGEAIGAIVTGTMDTIKGIFKLALDLIHGDWEGAWGDITGIVNAQAKAVEGFVTGFLNLIAGLFDTSLADIARTWEDNWNMLVDIATSIDWGQVGADVIAGIVSGIESNAGRLMSTLRSLANDALAAAKAALGISSPSTAFMPVGQFITEGIMEGIMQGWPALTDQLGALSDDLVSKMEDVGQRIQDAIAGSFGATATVDRQLATNLDKLSKMTDAFYKTAAERQLQAAADQARAFADPETGAKFFALRSKQIFEFMDLQKKINEETNAETKASLQQQQILILKAQEAEQAAFDAKNPRADTGQSDLIKMLGDLLSNPAIDSTSGIGDLLNKLLTQLEVVSGGYAPPPGSPYATNTNTQTTTLNMPIYTNQSPGVLQDSMAIAGAALL